jgi:hypothetical protein
LKINSLRKTYKYIFFILLTTVLLASAGCKKYEEGPWLSLRSKKSRVVGVWKFKEVIADGQDITNKIQLDNIGFENGSGCYYVSVNKTTYEEFTLFGKWSFANNKNDLNISLSADGTDTITGKPVTFYVDYYFKILELRYKEIKLEGTSKTTFNGKIESSNLKWTLKQ